MTKDYQLENRVKKITALRDKRKEIMALSPEKALDAILSSPFPAELVQSFAEQDFYFLVHDIGVADAVPLLSLAHSDQWGYMLDVEIWDKDRMNIDTVTHWMAVLLHADSRRLVNWLLMERLDFLELYLFRNLDVIVREENQDPSDFPDGFFTVDDYFYVRVKDKAEPLSLEDTDEPVSQDDLEGVIRTLLNEMISVNHYLYQNILLEAMSIIPAETEEEDFRLRNVRLAEKGFLPFDEALEVFSPLDPDLIGTQPVKRMPLTATDPGWMPAPMTHVRQIKGRNVFSESLALLEDRYDLADLEMEFAALCNQIIAAENKTIQSREALSAIAKKAGSYVSLGLEVLLAREGSADDETRIRLILAHSLKSLFRVGVDRISKLSSQAKTLTRKSWYSRHKLPLSFWGEQGMGVLGGLLVPKPVFFDNYVSGKTLYRDFETLADTLATEEVLSGIQGLDDLLSVLDPRLKDFRGQHLSASSLMMTLFVHARNGNSPENEGPVALAELKAWYEQIWESTDHSVDQAPVKIKESERNEMLSWLSQRTGFTKDEISRRLGAHLEAMFREFEDEYGAVSPDGLSAQFVTHVCLRED